MALPPAEPAALVALAPAERAELARDDAEADADAPAVEATEAAEAALDETELPTEAADPLAAEAPEDALLEALSAPEEAEACGELAFHGTVETNRQDSLLRH